MTPMVVAARGERTLIVQVTERDAVIVQLEPDGQAHV